MDPYEIVFTYTAQRDLKALRKYEQQIVLDGIFSQLLHEPAQLTQNRKPLEPNSIAAWEMRVSRYRVFYEVEEQARIVAVVAIGFKIGSQLFIRGEKRKL